MKNTGFFLFILFLTSSCKDDDYHAPFIETSYKEIIDTSYGEDLRHNIDLYLPKNRNLNTKLIVMIHGGAWVSGDKSELNKSVAAIKTLDPTIAIANINYRLIDGQSVFIEDQLADVNKAISFILANTQKFNISNKIALVGTSSGAHLSMVYAYKYDNSKVIRSVGNYFGPSRLDAKEWYDSFNLGLFISVEDLLYPLFGKQWNQDLYSSFSPYAVVNSNNGKPTISFHGGYDPVVPKNHSKDLDAKLKQLSIPSEYHEYPNSSHILFDTDLADSYPKLLKFINKYW
jgi:acetyl esterase/lipase